MTAQQRAELPICRIGERCLTVGEVCALWELLPSGPASADGPQASAPSPAPGSSALAAAVTAFRYRHGLISADECTRWLQARGLSYAALQSSLARRLEGRAATTPAQREADRLLDPTWPARARALAARLALRPDPLAAPLTAADWPALQQGFERWCAGICVADARQSRLAQDRLQWLSLEVAWIEFDALDAAREGWCCVALDGTAMAAVAAMAGLPHGQRRARLHTLPPSWSAALFRIAPGAVCPPLEDQGRWWLLALLAVEEATLAQAEVQAGVDAALVEDAVDLLLAERIQWLL